MPECIEKILKGADKKAIKMCQKGLWWGLKDERASGGGGGTQAGRDIAHLGEKLSSWIQAREGLAEPFSLSLSHSLFSVSLFLSLNTSSRDCARKIDAYLHVRPNINFPHTVDTTLLSSHTLIIDCSRPFKITIHL